MANFIDVAERKSREYDFTDGDFERVRKLIYEHAGISLSVSKQDMVYSRLARRLREKGLTRFPITCDSWKRAIRLSGRRSPMRLPPT